MDGNFYDQECNLRKVCKEFAVKMNATDCQPWTAIYTYTRCLLKELEYCMSVTSFSKETWRSIVWPALQVTLHKARMS